jgi:dipeptidyl-peptidase-3
VFILTFSLHQIDPVLHKEVKACFDKLNIAPYGGFVSPVFKLIENDATITDIEIEYPEDYTKQMLNYSENYLFL